MLILQHTPKKFTVLVREIHVSHMEVEAANEEEAIENVRRGIGEEVASEYSHSLSKDTWTVEEKL